MTRTAAKRCTLLPAIAVLAADGIVFPGYVFAAPIHATYVGPTLDKLRVVVQVSIVVNNGKIIAVRPKVSVRTPRSRFINLTVVPLLTQEVLQAQSANIQVVSGATVTSRAYAASLQAAITKARKAQAL